MSTDRIGLPVGLQGLCCSNMLRLVIGGVGEILRISLGRVETSALLDFGHFMLCSSSTDSSARSLGEIRFRAFMLSMLSSLSIEARGISLEEIE